MVLPLHDSDFYIAANQVKALNSTVTVALTGVIGLPALLATALLRRREAALQAREAIAAEAGADTRVLRAGKTVLHGEVVGDLGTPCVSIRIRQTGREYTVKSSRRHKWTEVERVIAAKPFALRLASGESVDVTPGDDVMLVDWLGTEVSGHYGMERFRVAELKPRARVFVEGELVAPAAGAAYRGGASAFSLRRGRDAPMRISVEPLERRHQERARHHGRWAIGLAAAVFVVNVVFFGAFWRGLAFGQAITAPVDPRTWTARGKHNVMIRHYGVMPSFDAAEPASPAEPVEVSRGAYDEATTASTGERPSLPFVVIPGTDTFWVGLRPTLNVASFALGWSALLMLSLAYFSFMRHHRPWYDRKRIVDDGAGPLGGPDALE